MLSKKVLIVFSGYAYEASVITYGYDPGGFLSSKQFLNGMESNYTYNMKGQLTSLIHTDKAGTLDAYQYEYDITGNKTRIEKSRRGLEQESGTYTYAYDPIGRLAGVSKDGSLLRAYGYDAYGNRSSRQEGDSTTTYRYNALNQLVKKADHQAEEGYRYDKRGNLTEITKNGNLTNQYFFGALDRLEMAVNRKGEAARYTYNGLGHRVGKETGSLTPQTGQPVLPREAALDPVSRIQRQDFRPEKRIEDTIDLTREYHNLLERREDGKKQSWLWDGFAAGMVEEGKEEHPCYYLQDDLGSPVRLVDDKGDVREAYGYDEFGQDLYQNQESIQPFGYTGYQMDPIAGTYYAQAREYQPENGRFARSLGQKSHHHLCTACFLPFHGFFG